MWLPGHVLAGLHVALVAASLVGAGPVRQTTRASHAIRDSVTMRVMFKSWGGEMDICNGPEWGWDSLTWRVRPGDPVGHTFSFFNSPPFRLGRALAADSVRLFFQHHVLALEGQPARASSTFGWDSVVVTTRPTAFRTINVDDALMWFRLKVVSPWPEPRREPPATTTLRGSIVDDSTGCPIHHAARVVVVGTRLGAYTDSLGGFNISDVPVGQIGVDACAETYISTHIDTRVPGDSLAIRLRRDPRLRVIGSRPCR
jgi:hypothetical protein